MLAHAVAATTNMQTEASDHDHHSQCWQLRVNFSEPELLS